MANTIVQLHTLPSLGALTLKLYPRVGGAIQNGAGGDTMTEDGTVAGLYQATVTEALVGIYAARVYSGSDLLGSFLVDLLDDTSSYDLADPAIAVGANDLAASEIAANIDVGDVTVNATVQPYSSTAPQRVKGTRLTLKQSEFGFWVQMTSYDAERNVLDFTGKTLRLTIAANDPDSELGEPGEILATLDEAPDVLEKVDADAGIWRFKSTAAMCPDVAMNSDAHWWSLADVTGGTIDEELAWGRLWVEGRAGH